MRRVTLFADAIGIEEQVFLSISSSGISLHYFAFGIAANPCLSPLGMGSASSIANVMSMSRLYMATTLVYGMLAVLEYAERDRGKISEADEPYIGRFHCFGASSNCPPSYPSGTLLLGRYERTRCRLQGFADPDTAQRYNWLAIP